MCCMLHALKTEVFILGGVGGGWETQSPLSEFSGSAPDFCQPTVLDNGMVNEPVRHKIHVIKKKSEGVDTL